MKLRSPLLAMALLVLAVVVLQAAVPQQISYQGRLTSATSTPITGTKNLTFKIYSGAGAVLWNSGAVAVTCTEGLFSVNLGAPPQPALPSTVFSDTAATLGVTVESDPELTPRTRLTSSPFSFSTLKASDYLPLTGGTLTGGVTWDFSENDISITHDAAGTHFMLSGPSGTSVHLNGWSDGGRITVRDGLLKGGIGLVAQTSVGGRIDMFDANGQDRMILTSGYLWLLNSAGVTMDHLLPFVGDAYTILPDSAIGAREIADEPGVAGRYDSTNLYLTTTMQDLTTVNLTIPTAGWIMLTGKVCEIDMSGTCGENWAVIQIDETAGGGSLKPYASAVGGMTYPDLQAHWFTATAQRTYFKNAGTYTFRLEGLRGGAVGGQARAFYPALTAVYYPTSYGDVIAPVSATEAGQFERATAIGTTDLYMVDLRELELKAAKARAEAEKAERTLLEARLNLQTNR